MEDRPAPALTAPARLYALDNLRALMMWLGIVLHVAVIHMVKNSPLPWQDETRTRVADTAVGFIHAFRMPVFFILAGFFVALLLQSRGASGMARHRALRLGLPFAVFWPIVYPLCGLFALAFMHRMARGTWGLDRALTEGHPLVPPGLSTMHMWFIWLLLWMCLGAALVARWVPASWFARPAMLLQRLGAAWWGPLVLALPLVVAGLPYPMGLLKPAFGFLVPWPDWLHNGLFFVFGLALFHHQWDLFALYRKRWPVYLAAGLVTFLVAGALMESRGPSLWISFVYNLTTWFLSFAAIGLALRVLDRRTAWLAYLADSSYWVYLVHMPLTIGFGALLFGLPLPALAKIALNIAATTLVCLASYHLVVRFTWVSVLLNGKRHARHTSSSELLRHA